MRAAVMVIVPGAVGVECCFAVVNGNQLAVL